MLLIDGITLITLVITIVILLIIAGIVLTFVLGENGLIERAQQAKLKQIKEDVLEDVQLKILEVQTENEGRGTLQQVVEKLNSNEQNEYLIKYSSKFGKLNSTGDITEESLSDTSKMDELNSKSYIFVIRNDVEVMVRSNLKAEVVEEAITEKPKYTLSYNLNIDELAIPEAKIVDEGTTQNIDFSQVPNRDGYDFLGWSTNKDATTPEYTSTSEIKTIDIENSNVTLYAIWKEKEAEPVTPARVLKKVEGIANPEGGWYEKNHNYDTASITKETTLTFSTKYAHDSGLFVWGDGFNTGLKEVVFYTIDFNTNVWTVYNNDTMYGAYLTYDSCSGSGYYSRCQCTSDNYYDINGSADKFFDPNGNVIIRPYICAYLGRLDGTNLTYNMAFKIYIMGSARVTAWGYE